MEVIVKSSPKIEIELATKVVKVGGKVTVDSALSTESENPVQNKVITEELGKKATKEGNYPSLRVGTADTAIDLAGRGESVPAEFGFRASGSKSIKDGRAYIKRIKGNSVVWNQKYPDDWTYKMYGITSTSINGLISIEGTSESTITQLNPFTADELNHKYLFVLSGASSQMEGKRFQLHNRSAYSIISGGFAYLLYENTLASKGTYFGLSGLSAGDVISEHNIRVNQYDLTQMFQAGNEPTTIEDFYARVATLGVDMNAYNEGQVIHCNTESIKSVGDNAWDEEWEVGNISGATGTNINSDSLLRSKNFIPIIPTEKYYSTIPFGRGVFFYDDKKQFIKRLYNLESIPQNARYMRFVAPAAYGTTYKNDIMISLVHSGWKQDTDAGYQPYWQDTLPLSVIRKYFPDGMKSAGSAHDEIRYNKVTQKWEAVQRIGEVDMGTLNYFNNTNNGGYFHGKLGGAKTPSSWALVGNLLSGLYSKTYADNIAQSGATPANMSIALAPNGYIYVVNTSYTDAATFKTEMQGVMLYYELAEPIVTELDAEDQNFRDYYNVADFGTEQSQSSVPSAPFSADIIYQFNAVDMIREHELEITELQSIITEQQSVIATMQAQLTSLINGGQ